MKKGIDQKKVESLVFPNHVQLSCMNFMVDMGSFDVPLPVMLDYGLSVLKAMRDIERESV